MTDLCKAIIYRVSVCENEDLTLEAKVSNL